MISGQKNQVVVNVEVIILNVNCANGTNDAKSSEKFVLFAEFAAFAFKKKQCPESFRGLEVAVTYP